MPVGIKHLYLLYLFRFLENFVTLDLVNFRDLVNFSPLPKKFTKSRFTCNNNDINNDDVYFDI